MGRHTTKLGEASRAEKRPPLPYPVRDGRVSPPKQEAMDRRAQRRRSRLAALSAASMLALGGAASVGMAMAEEPEASGGGEIVFSGDCGALGVVTPSSRPNASEVTVTEGSRVSYTNDLGTDAELHVGNESYDIGAGSSQVFVMNRSAEVAMVPDCRGLFAQYESAQVNVVDAPQSEEQDTSSGQDDSEPSEAELPSRGSGEDTASGTDGADAGQDASAEDAAPQEGGDRPADGEEPSEEPAEETSEEDEVNSFGPAGDDAEGSGEPGLDPAAEEVVAVDPKAVSDGASGLLALVAIVCLVGVSAAVMRTILKQRATA
ncbi:hypothetical protein [Glycomyces tenuis]|uniref:hypothetical protein n=1 Tax=Glycomyces tenuis TaxID=58116 RepID=UPI000428AC6E|nr:hypothetical protein [Glycomyces tenuis]